MKIAIYGAKSLALGMYRAIELLYPEQDCVGFVVNSKDNNPSTLAGLPVIELQNLKDSTTPEERESLCFLICTPEDIHGDIVGYLEENGFKSYICMDSRKEAKLMEQYFVHINKFVSLHSLPYDFSISKLDTPMEIYQAKFHKDRTLKDSYDLPEWVIPIQVGTALGDIKIAEICDSSGDNISHKNTNYCELTALYWIWKNRLIDEEDNPHCEDREKYFGLWHYRRILDIDRYDVSKMIANDIDIVVPYPTLHEPDIKEHHTRYLKESDWEAMLQALEELQPEYRDAYEDIFSQEYMYNYNMLVAKKSVLKDYCEWLFPILERTEELSSPKGWERSDRYIGYLGENLMTLYLLYNKDKYNIAYTGRIMLT